MQRRSVIAWLGAAVVGTGAGCTSDGSRESTPPADGSGTSTPTPTPAQSTPEPNVLGSDIETTATDCKSGDEERATATVESAAVTIEGVTEAPDQCRKATIESATVTAGELRVRIGTESTAEMCAQCVGAITYEGSIDVENADALDAVTIVHAYTGNEFTTQCDDAK